jgi:hypothetical protein
MLTASARRFQRDMGEQYPGDNFEGRVFHEKEHNSGSFRIGNGSNVSLMVHSEMLLK